jgi:hypothetical protein
MQGMTDEGESRKPRIHPHQPAKRRAASPKGEAKMKNDHPKLTSAKFEWIPVPPEMMFFSRLS